VTIADVLPRRNKPKWRRGRRADGEPTEGPKKKWAKLKKGIYEPSPKVEGKYCEICHLWDPYVLDIHHIEPRERGTRIRQKGNQEEIVLCANCHVRCHRLFGGVSGRPYQGPTEKGKLVEALRLARLRYQKNNPYLRRKTVEILTREMILQIIKEKEETGATVRALASKYGIAKTTLCQLIKSGGELKKGRHLRFDEIAKIHASADRGKSIDSLAEEYGVHWKTIVRVLTRKR
jgi:transposase-like protein